MFQREQPPFDYNEIQEHKVLVFVEYVHSPARDEEWEGPLRETNTFQVSTRKLPQFLEENEFALGYVRHLIDGALRGRCPTDTGEKCSFTDGGPSWYGSLTPDAGCTDEVVTNDVTVFGKY